MHQNQGTDSSLIIPASFSSESPSVIPVEAGIQVFFRIPAAILPQ
jgi:hypothetical protein